MARPTKSLHFLQISFPLQFDQWSGARHIHCRKWIAIFSGPGLVIWGKRTSSFVPRYRRYSRAWKLVECVGAMGTVAGHGVVGGLVIAAAVPATTSAASSLRRDSSTLGSQSGCSWKMSSLVSGARMMNVEGNGDAMLRPNGAIRAVASEPRAAISKTEPGDISIPNSRFHIFESHIRNHPG